MASPSPGTYPPDSLLPDATLPNDSDAPEGSLGQVTPPATRPRRFNAKVLWLLAIAGLAGIGAGVWIAGQQVQSDQSAPAR